MCKELSELHEHPHNPRYISKADYAQLKESIEKFGLSEKLVINTDNTIIGGHQRKKVLEDLGIKKVDCWVPDRALTETEVYELNVRFNRNHGQWDWDILANFFEPSDLTEWGFKEEELDVDLASVNPEETEQDNEVLEPTKNPITKPGDLYVLGKHRLLCGDSTSKDDVDKLISGGLIDDKPILMVTDPPYGVDYDASWRKGTPGALGKKWAVGCVKNDSQINWSDAWDLFPGSVAYVWCASWFLPEMANGLDRTGFERKSLIIWNKQHFAMSRGDYHWKHEPCWYAVKKGHKHNWQGSRKESTVWEISNLGAFGKSNEEGDERTAHSTQKPIECMAKPIRNNTCIGESVYDPFVGSGTTLIAAEQLNRRSYCMEIDPAYCDIAVDRWVKFRLKKNHSAAVYCNGEHVEWKASKDEYANEAKD